MGVRSRGVQEGTQPLLLFVSGSEDGRRAGFRFLVPGAWSANSKNGRKQGTAPTTEEILMIFRP